jgi:hypothetical protein
VRQASTQRSAHLISLEGTEPQEGALDTSCELLRRVGLCSGRVGRTFLMYKFAFAVRLRLRPQDYVVGDWASCHSWRVARRQHDSLGFGRSGSARGSLSCGSGAPLADVREPLRWQAYRGEWLIGMHARPSNRRRVGRSRFRLRLDASIDEKGKHVVRRPGEWAAASESSRLASSKGCLVQPRRRGEVPWVRQRGFGLYAEPLAVSV